MAEGNPARHRDARALRSLRDSAATCAPRSAVRLRSRTPVLDEFASELQPPASSLGDASTPKLPCVRAIRCDRCHKIFCRCDLCHKTLGSGVGIDDSALERARSGTPSTTPWPRVSSRRWVRGARSAGLPRAGRAVAQPARCPTVTLTRISTWRQGAAATRERRWSGPDAAGATQRPLRTPAREVYRRSASAESATQRSERACAWSSRKSSAATVAAVLSCRSTMSPPRRGARSKHSRTACAEGAA